MEGLLISYPIVPKDVGFEARFEVLNIIEEVAKDFPIIRKVSVKLRPGGYKGLILLDLRPVLSELDDEERKHLEERIINEFENKMLNEALRYISKFTVLDAIVNTDINEIAKAVDKLKDKVRGKWRITLKTRKYPIDRKELIQKAAEPIDRPVDLENPEYIVLIEIFGELTGIAVLSTKNED